ncbi:MAG: leucine-rich repeat domain-containing protein [Ruminococcus sp.]|nr:leucine-rich repeat domain-containing protein [Ruminococcus sp.]
MFEYKKFTAFLASMLICVSATVSTMSTFAEEDITELTSDTVTDNEVSDETAPEDFTTDEISLYSMDSESGNINSGDFEYSVIDDNCICIEGYSGTETDLVIPDTIDGMTVTEISGKAFGNTPDQPYETISIPASVTYISEDNPFMYCPSLREIIVSPDNENYIVEDGVLYTSNKELLVCYPSARTGNSLSIPEGVKEIGIASILNTTLTEIKFPSTLENIRRFGLRGNERLKSVDMSGTALEVIDTAGFAECTSLNEIILPDTLVYIETIAFMNCSSLADVTLPDSLVYIGQYAFTGTALTKIIVPDSVTEIGYGALGYEDEDTPVSDFLIIGSYNSEAHIYSTDSDDEYGYKNEFQFTTPEAYAEQAEYDSLDKDIYGDFEYTAIDGEAVITGCNSILPVVEVPSEINGMTVTRIYTSAFENSTAEEIIIPETVKTIDKLAFYNCSELKTLTIKGAETIGDSAFVMCVSLVNLTISGNCQTIEGDEPFISCTLLENIDVTDGDGAYSSENGVLYNKDKTVLLVYPASKADKEFKVPSGVKEISVSAFCNNKYLETVDVSGVERIGAYAFEGSKNLKKAILSDSLKTVEIYAFADCPAMNSIRIPASVETISDYSFGYRFDDSGNNSETDNMITVDGFKIYAESGSRAYQYANACKIEVVSGTVEIFGKNVVKGFLWAVCGVVGVLVAGLVCFGIFRKVKKKGK